MSLKCLSENDSRGPWKVLIGLCTAGHKPACNQLIEMKINDDLMSGNTMSSEKSLCCMSLLIYVIHSIWRDRVCRFMRISNSMRCFH